MDRGDVRARLGWPSDPGEHRRIRRLWQRHSIAEDRRDIDGLIATLAPGCVYEIVGNGPGGARRRRPGRSHPPRGRARRADRRQRQEARGAVDAGVDIIVAQGWEAGGHVWGEVSTLTLVPAVVDAVGTTPVIAAGGIADGRGLAAVLALGAGAAWMGTRFVASVEAPAHPDYVARVLGAAETGTFHSKLFDIGWPDAAHRVLRNATIDAWLEAAEIVRRTVSEAELILARLGAADSDAAGTPAMTRAPR